MRRTIFDLESRINFIDEYIKIIEMLFRENVIYFRNNAISLYSFYNKYCFKYWKYRETYSDIEEYCERFNLNLYKDYEYVAFNSYYNIKIKEEDFLFLLEMLLNMQKVANEKYDYSKIIFNDNSIKELVSHNICFILEKMNYQSIEKDDKVIIIKRDADVDSILDIVDNDIREYLLSYNDIRCNNIEDKKSILKKLDLFLDNHKKHFQDIDSNLLNDIDFIINKFGINHIDDEYKNKIPNNKELMILYDKIFKMIIHLLRKEEIDKYRKEIKRLKNK